MKSRGKLESQNKNTREKNKELGKPRAVVLRGLKLPLNVHTNPSPGIPCVMISRITLFQYLLGSRHLGQLCGHLATTSTWKGNTKRDRLPRWQSHNTLFPQAEGERCYDGHTKSSQQLHVSSIGSMGRRGWQNNVWARSRTQTLF